MPIFNFFQSNPQNWQAVVCAQTGRRDENQDNHLIIKSCNGKSVANYLKNQQPVEKPIDGWDDRYSRVAVLDGMGGHQYGREISEKAVEELLKLPPQTDITAMRAHIQAIHDTLYKHFPGSEKRPGTTLVMADIDVSKRRGVMAHIGDSRVYLIQKDKIRQLTCDHHSNEFALRDGEIKDSDYQKRLETGKFRIVQALGYGSFGIIKEADGYKPYRVDSRIRLDVKKDLPKLLREHADIFHIKLSVNDILMLGSDGLWSADPNYIWQAPPNEIHIETSDARKIAERSFRFGSKDNITVVLCGFADKTP